MPAFERILRDENLTARLALTTFVGVVLLLVLVRMFRVHHVVRDMLSDAAVSRWPCADCVITDSSWRRTGRSWRGCPRFAFEVEYQYTFEGQKHTSRTVSRGYRMSTNSWQAKKLAQEYPPNAKATCYVDPRDPSSAVLRRNPVWTDRVSLTFFFAVVSLAIGGVFLRVVWRLPRHKRTSTDPAQETMPSLPRSQTDGPPGKWMFTAFLLFGCAFGYIIFGRPVLRVLAARDWRKTSCVVVLSKTEACRTDEGTCHRASVAYAYEVDGRTYRSRHYSLMDGSLGSFDRLREFLREHPADTDAVCYVNPANPSEAVLNRSLVCHVGPLAAVPVMFALIGAGGLIYLFFRGSPGVAYGPGPNQSLQTDG